MKHQIQLKYYTNAYLYFDVCKTVKCEYQKINIYRSVRMSKLGLVTGYLICHSSLRCCDTDWTSRFCGSLFQLSILGCCMCNAGLKTVCRLLWASLSSGAVSPPCYWSLSGQCGHCSVVSGHCGRVTVLLVTQWSLWTCDRVTGHSVVIVVTA